MSYTDRVIVLVDMDCFYCQVEEKLDPKLEGKPIAVVQYNAWRGGGIIAVNYPAREKGVTRGMRGDEAKKKCPDIMLPKIPAIRGKADLTKYRDAGKRVADVLHTFTPLLQRASVDEAYLDITEQVNQRLARISDEISLDKLPNTFVVGFEMKDFLENLKRNELDESDLKLAVGGIITEEIRAKVYEQTGYKCSAGIAHNKVLAKLVCSLHKPNKQTILPQNAISELYKNLPIRKIQSLGGKLGNTIVEELQISYMGDLIKFNERELIKKFDEKTGKWLYNIARGIDLEPVTTQLISKSIGCCKQFRGNSALKTPESVEHWINELAEELSERLVKDLEENSRKARQMVITFTQKVNNDFVNSARNHSLSSYDKTKIAQGAIDVLRRFCLKANGLYHLTYLGINVGNFQDLKNSKNLKLLFQNMQTTQTKIGSREQLKPNQSSFFEKYLEEKEMEEKTNSKIENEKENKKNEDQNQSSFFEKYLEEKEEEKTNSKTENEKVNIEKTEDQDGSEYLQKDSNASIYSASTDDLNEDQKSLIYFEDVFSETDSKLAIFKNPDTIEHSAGQIYDIKPEVERTSTRSFFLNYLKNEGKVKNEKVVDEDEQMVVNDDNRENNIYLESAEIISNGHEEASSSNGILEICDRQICSECNKTIVNEEYLSHLDYHFALKMVKEEAHLYKNLENFNVSNKVNREEKNKKKSAHKRKISETITKPETKAIQTFFNKIDESELNENNSDLCADCNKRIKFEDIASHMDYHTAKKLHHELNSNLKIHKNRTSPVVKVKDKKSKSIKNIGTISSFFKSGS